MRRTLNEDMLAAAAAVGPTGVFLLETFGRRVSFASQQVRALKLVSALAATARIAKGDRVAVVGAGIAGLTAAVALEGLDCDVVVIEPATRPLANLRHSSRYLHPSISHWPETPLALTTELPFLDWYATSASEVAATVEAQATALLRAPVRYGCKVRSLVSASDGRVRLVVDPVLPDPVFDAVLITTATGSLFGEESARSPSYWADDSLEYDRDRGHARRFVVYGCGDGGLSDALRLAHVGYADGRLAVDVAQHLENSNLAHFIREQERSAAAADRPGRAAIYQEAAERLSRDRECAEIYALLRRSSASGAQIILADNDPCAPYVAESSPINKLLIADAIRCGAVTFLEGPVRVDTDRITIGSQVFEQDGVQLLYRARERGDYENLFRMEDLQEHRARMRAIVPELDIAFWDTGQPNAAAPPHDPSSPEFRHERFPLARLAMYQTTGALLSLSADGFVVQDAPVPGDIPKSLFGVPVFVEARASEINLAALSPEAFENLVLRLLAGTGLSLRAPAGPATFDFEVEATGADTLGIGDHAVLEIKHNQQGRMGVAELRDLLQRTRATGDRRCILVTSGRLTSVARDFLESEERLQGQVLRVIDGAELSNLLRESPEIGRRYFPWAEAV